MEITITAEQQQVLNILCARSIMPVTAEELISHVVNQYIESKKQMLNQEFSNGPSEIERLFQAERDAVKSAFIQYIKANPECLMEAVLTHCAPLCSILQIENLLPVYITGSFEKGFIAENTFDAFRDFVLERTIEELMSI